MAGVPLRCPGCNVVSISLRWGGNPTYGDMDMPDDTFDSYGCEDCGTHPAYRCPECHEIFDSIQYDINEFRVTDAQVDGCE